MIHNQTPSLLYKLDHFAMQAVSATATASAGSGHIMEFFDIFNSAP
jgi:hypothetical protein